MGEKGPVQILCEEIDFAYDARMERTDLLVAFVGQLVEVIRRQRDTASAIVKMTGKPPSEGSGEVLELVDAMLAARETDDIIAAASRVHDASWRLNPEDAYPTDHYIDMLSSCASALRFGLETPCRSRHAAAAANHVWKRTYGISLFDSHSPAWGREWARSMLQSAILSLLSPPE